MIHVIYHIYFKLIQHESEIFFYFEYQKPTVLVTVKKIKNNNSYTNRLFQIQEVIIHDI